MRNWIILLIICLDWSLMWIDFTAVNVALAPIAKDLHTNLGTLQWIITAYTLCSASLMAIGGRLGDIYGHRRLFIIGTLIFVISSGLAGFASDITLLIASRVGQGIGIAMVVPITTALVYLTFEEKQQGLALGFLTGTTGVAMAIGPTVGGILITYLNWRWVFFINIPIGLFAIVMGYILISETREKKNIRIDIPGIITLSLGLFCLLLALNKISEWGLSISLIGLFALAIFLLIMFIKIEEKSQEPLIHLDLLKSKVLIGIISARTCAQYVFFVFMFFICLYLQNIQGFSAEKAGYLLLASTIVLGILSPFAGHLMNYFSARFLIAISCFILTISLLLLIFSSLTQSMPYLFSSLILFGIAFAIHFPTTNLAALQTAPTHQSALVTGMLFTLAFAGASAGITLSSTLLNDLSKYKLMQLINNTGIQFSPDQKVLMQGVASGVQSLNALSVLPATIVQKSIQITEEAFVFGFVGILIICMILAIVATLIAIFALKKLSKIKKRKDNFVLEL